MTRLFGQDWTRAALLERVGDVSQVGGARLIRFAEGPESGVLAAQIRTGSGFAFTVLPDRGMDIGYAEYRGMPLCWRSATGEIQAAMYEPEEQGWLRGFSGGLMATCGLTQAGWVSTAEDGSALGLHGRASYLQARGVHVDGAWDGDDYVMWAQGKTRQTVPYGENVQLTRRVWARLGENRLFVDDVVENLGHERVPHMLAYHVNGGFPILDAGSELVTTFPSTNPQPMSEDSIDAVDDYQTYRGPQPGWSARVLLHRPTPDADGWAQTALVNRNLGLGLYVKQRPEQLPFLWQWKQTGQGTYVTGIEPANCTGRGQADDRANGTLQFLEPGERRTYNVEIGVLEL